MPHAVLFQNKQSENKQAKLKLMKCPLKLKLIFAETS